MITHKSFYKATAVTLIIIIIIIIIIISTLWLFNIAMETGSFIEDLSMDLPMKNGWIFP